MLIKLKILIIPILTLVSCGLPSDEFIDDLNAPKLLSGSRIGNAITISFVAYNPEARFTGYNIYIGESENDIINYKDAHIKSDNTVNEVIEKDHIIKNEDLNNIPTIQDGDTFPINPRNNPSTISYSFTKKPNGEPLQAVDYYISVTAYSTTNHAESTLSEVVIINS